MAEAKKLFDINRKAFSRRYDIVSATDAQTYCATQSTFSHSKPDVTLRAGTDEDGPVVAACYLQQIGASIKVGLGDPDQPNEMQWEEMEKVSKRHSQYDWEMNIPSIAGGTGRRKKFSWKRTHSVAVDGSSSKLWGSNNFKLLDAETEEVVAVFTSKRTITKCGQLQVNVHFGLEFDTFAIMSILALYEDAARRRRRHAALAAASS